MLGGLVKIKKINSIEILDSRGTPTIMTSIELEDAIKVVSNTHYFTLAESLGGVESLVCHPSSMTHAAIPKKEREKSGLLDSLIRLSVGIEDIDDLIDDLDDALN